MTAPLTREQVANLKPNEVHNVLRRVMLVDGFDLVRHVPHPSSMLHSASFSRYFAFSIQPSCFASPTKGFFPWNHTPENQREIRRERERERFGERERERFGERERESAYPSFPLLLHVSLHSLPVSLSRLVSERLQLRSTVLIVPSVFRFGNVFPISPLHFPLLTLPDSGCASVCERV